MTMGLIIVFHTIFIATKTQISILQAFQNQLEMLMGQGYTMILDKFYKDLMFAHNKNPTQYPYGLKKNNRIVSVLILGVGQSLSDVPNTRYGSKQSIKRK